MKPILFEKTATTFDSLGLCRLPDAISCMVTEERNGEFELELVYPAAGVGFDEIQEDRIIVAKAREDGTKQAFRIYRITTLLDGEITVNARHISYQLNFVPVPAVSGSGTAQDMMQALASAAEGSVPFSFWSDITGTHNYSIGVPASLRTMLGGMQGSVLDSFGGEYEWDNWMVKLHAARGSDKGVRIAYGKNITALDRSVDIGSTITGVMAYYAGQDDKGNEVLVYSNPRVITNNNVASFAHARTVVLDVSGEFQSVPTTAQVTAYATQYLAATSLASASEALTVDFVPLWQTAEYAETYPEHIDLCDTVTVVYKVLGVNVKKKVTKTVYNVLLDRYDSIELGGEENVADAIVGMADEVGGNSDEIASLMSSKANVDGSNIDADTWRDVLGLPSGVLIQYGKTTLSGGTSSVTFGKAFASAPTVLVGIQGSATNIYDCRPYNITTSGFSAICRAYNGTSIYTPSDGTVVHWIAIGVSA